MAVTSRCAARQFAGAQRLVVASQRSPAAHAPQSSVCPQPSEIVPQLAPRAAQVVGVQPHWFTTPPPPQVSGSVHSPHERMAPQPSEMRPQRAPKRAQEAGWQVLPSSLHVVGPTPTHT